MTFLSIVTMAWWGWDLATQQSANSHAHHTPVALAWLRDVSSQLLCTMYDTVLYFKEYHLENTLDLRFLLYIGLVRLSSVFSYFRIFL